MTLTDWFNKRKEAQQQALRENDVVIDDSVGNFQRKIWKIIIWFARIVIITLE